MVGKAVLPTQPKTQSNTMATPPPDTIYDAYPLTLRSYLASGPPPLERALSQQRLASDDSMAARRMRDLFERPSIDNAVDENDGPTSPDAAATRESAMYQRERAQRRSASMFTRFGKFTGEVYETKERSRVFNALKRRSRTAAVGGAQPLGGAGGGGGGGNQLSASTKFTADDVLRAGTLTKQGSWRRNWKTRFFLLRRDYPSLSYYKSEEKLELLGAISVTGDTLVLDKSVGGNAPYRFQLRTQAASLLLEAETRDSQQRWMDACQELVDTVRAEKFRQSTMFADRDPTTASIAAQARQSVSALRHSVAATTTMTSCSLPSASILKPRTPGRIAVDNQQLLDDRTSRDLRRPSDLDELLDGSSDSSSDEEDNQKEEEEDDDDDDDDDIWATGRSQQQVVLDDQANNANNATNANNANNTNNANKSASNQMNRRGSLVSASSSNQHQQNVSSNPPHTSYDLVVELVLGRQSKLLSRSESSSDKLSCCVKVVGYSSVTKQTEEIGTTDAVKLAAAVASSQAQTQAAGGSSSLTPVRVTFSVVLRLDLSCFDQLRFTVYRTSSSASKPTTVGLGRCFVDDEFRSLALPRLVPLTEKSSSFPDVLASARAEPPSLLSLHQGGGGGGGGGSGGSSKSLLAINGNSVQLLVQAFPAKPLQEVLPTAGIDMASTKYLLPTTLSIEPSESESSPSTNNNYAEDASGYALIENGSFLTTTSESPAPPNARLIVVDEILRVPRSTFALPLAFLDFLEETALERTRFLQKQIEADADKTKLTHRGGADGGQAMDAYELEFYRKKLEEYLRQRQFLMKQEKRLLEESADHKVFNAASTAVARMAHKTKSMTGSRKDVLAGLQEELVAPFKRSTYKSLDLWQFLPTNMQNQFLCVHQPRSGEEEKEESKRRSKTPFAWHTMTMGCPAAHTKGFANGGFPLSASVESSSRLSCNPASSGYSDESDSCGGGGGALSASDNEQSLERASMLGTQLETLRRRASLNRTSNSSNPASNLEIGGGAGGGGGGGAENSVAALKTKLELKERLEIIASQTLSAAIACLAASLDLAVSGSECHRQQLANATRFGYLINFESLLSTQGKEVGMLEDFAAGAKWLRSVFVQFRRHNPSNTANGQFFSIKKYAPPERRGLAGGTGLDGAYTPSASSVRDPSSSSSTASPPYLLVTMGVSDAQLGVLPPLLAGGKPLRLRCVLFSQGVNEKQSLVHALKSQTVKLQERINRENLEELKSIYALFRSTSNANASDTCSTLSTSTMDELLAQIDHHVCSSTNAFKKNVALLMDTSDFCREMGGARVTCCKSGKDRTAMSVTLEQARLCCAQLHVAQGQGKKLCATMRVAGVRRKNVFLNTKSTKFAFNEMQRKLLPECYKPPAGTYKSGKT